jgi:D-alanyl-D-alanine endopeptidase (penicillin-binding protein 7)
MRIMRGIGILVVAFSLVAGLGAAHARPGKRRHVADRPVAVYKKDGSPNIQAQAAVVVDLSSGEELLAKNADDVRPIASISKLMATLVIVDKGLDLDGITTMQDDDRKIASGGARSRLPVGMQFTNRDLLHAALMASDNRAVPALGRAVGWTPAELVSQMNAKAKALGLKNTHFEDPVGLSPGNTSTARDLVGLLRAASKNTLLTEITQKKTYVAHPVGKPGWTIEYANTDVIARGGRFEVLTGKTGYTDLALYCLAIAVKMLTDRPVAMVFLGAVGKMTRFGDFSRVAQWLVERRWGKRADL